MENKEFAELFSPLKFDIKGVKLPSLEIKENETGNSNLYFLKELVKEGIKKKTPIFKKSKYEERANLEIETIDSLGFTDYILLVWDVINFCKKNFIPVGMGRGSAAGSLVLYLIDVTKIDSLKHELYFERFISKIRAKKQVIDGITYLDGSLMCDVDLDICYRRRHEVVDYLKNKFLNKTCKVSTLNTLQGKLLIKECGKIIGNYSEEDVRAVADLIPQLFGKVEDIEKTYQTDERFKKWVDLNGKNKRIFNTALKLRGLIKNKSVHASAILISAENLEGNVPTELNSATKDIVSCYDMSWATLSNVKLDLLGLKCVTVAQDILNELNLKIEDIDLEDPFIYQNLYDLKSPHGIFQIEAPTVFSACRKIKPKNLQELSGTLAVARPGAMQFIDRYASFTNTGTVDSIHPFFDEILNKTGSLCLYQEQLMKMANKIGFSLDESETIRKVVGKKDTVKVKEWKSKIEDKVKEKGLDPEIFNVFWRILEDSANYSFNLSHSLSYASLSALTTYLKFKYPTEFFLSLLRMTKNEPDPIEEISKIVRELPKFGISLLRPDITKSEMDFSKEGADIRFGLSSIKGIAGKTIEKLIKFKHPHANKFSIFRAADESGLSIGVLSALIQAGAVQEFKQTRPKVVLEAQVWNEMTDKEKKWAELLGEENEWDLIKVLKILNEKKDEKGKLIIKDSRLGTIKKKFDEFLKIYVKNKDHQALANWYYEKKLLGFSPTCELRAAFNHTENFYSIAEVAEQQDGDRVEFIGVVGEAHSAKSKKGNKYLKIITKDETAEIPVWAFENREVLKNILESNGGKPPKEEDIIIVRGMKKGESVFADSIQIETTKIYTKLGDIKKEEKALENKEKQENI